MAMPSITTKSIVLFCIARFWTVSMAAQHSIDSTITLPAKHSQGEIDFKRHSLGFGSSVTGGDATTGQPGLMISSSYAYSLTPSSALEVSLHNVSWTVNSMGVTIQPIAYRFVLVSSMWMGDVSYSWQPIREVAGFRIGFGPSLRWQNSSVTALINASQVEVVSSETLALGAVCKLDYIFLPHPKVEIISRVQAHITAPPFLGENASAPQGVPGGMVSAGILLRLRW
jgi:hypothetical protein